MCRWSSMSRSRLSESYRRRQSKMVIPFCRRSTMPSKRYVPPTPPFFGFIILLVVSIHVFWRCYDRCIMLEIVINATDVYSVPSLNTYSQGRFAGELSELSSRFYTLIPHSFGRTKPPVIKDSETLKKKMAVRTPSLCHSLTASLPFHHVMTSLSIHTHTFPSPPYVIH